VAVIVVYPSSSVAAYDGACRAGNRSIGLSSRPILRSRAATQEKRKDNPDP
jgi:hypothetical protein